MTHDYDCDVCKKTYEILMSFEEFDKFEEEGQLCPVCLKKGIKTKLKKVWDASFVKIFLPGPGFTRKEV